MSALLFSRYVWISNKTKISFKTRPNLKKTYWSMMIMHIIFDLMGNDLQNWFMTYQWLELRWNTCLCENYTPLMRFSSIWMHPVFPLVFFRNKMRNDLNLIFGSVNSIFVLSFLIVAFWKMLFWLVWGLILYKACS